MVSRHVLEREGGEGNGGRGDIASARRSVYLERVRREGYGMEGGTTFIG